MKSLILIASLLIFTSCQESSQSSESSRAVNNISEVREELVETDIKVEEASLPIEKGKVCSMIYDPVCAQAKKDKDCIGDSCVMTKKTYSSECTASLDSAKVIYQGECYEDISEKEPDMIECPAVYSPVCGQLNNKFKQEKTFSNMCELDKGSAKFLRYGACDNNVDK